MKFPPVVGTVVADAGVGCDSISEYYLEIGCKPVQKAGNSSGCPVAFTCPEIAYPDPTRCYYRYGDSIMYQAIAPISWWGFAL